MSKPITYTREEVLEASRSYFSGDELAASVFLKYALCDNEGNYLERDPEQMHRALAREFARIELKYPNPISEQTIFNMFNRFHFVVPQGSPMSAVRNEFQLQSASNCFVIDGAYDSYGGILYTDQEQAQIMKRRGGVGHDVSRIRPRGLTTNNAARTTDGISVFMERFSNTTREVAQGGRRGALMLTIDCRHPEIETFIDIKRDRKKVTGANISIRWTDDFMRAVENDSEYEQRWPVDSDNPEITRMVRARDVWYKFIDSTWECAEPGALFWDTARRMTPSDAYEHKGFKSVCTNPCGEIILSPYDSCRLMAMNLLGFVASPFSDKAQFDWDLFKESVNIAQRLMDDLVDIEIEQVQKIIKKIKSDPEPEQTKKIELDMWNKIMTAARDGRRTGLGVTALADAMAAVGIKYGSPESIEFTELVYKTLCIESYRASCEMAAERGAFPAFSHEAEKDHPFIQRVMKTDRRLAELYKKHGRRNIANLTTAPTGSVSIMTQTSGGIEPVFELFHVRRKKINPSDGDVTPDFIDQMGDKWLHFKVYHKPVQRWMEVTGEKDIEKSPWNGACAKDIPWSAGVDIQAAAQKWVCHSISRTANLPSNVSKEKVSEIYIEAWKKGCKGFTIYREGSRDGVLVSDETSTSADRKIDAVNGRPSTIYFTNAPKRPESLLCDVHNVKVDGKNWACFVSLLDGYPFEIFTGLEDDIVPPKKSKHGLIVKRKTAGKSKYDVYFNKDQESEIVFKDITANFKNDEYAAEARLISLSLRHGVPIHHIVEQLQKIETEDMFGFNKVISRVLKHYVKDGIRTAKECSNCGEKALIYQEGCLTCSACGSSRC